MGDCKSCLHGLALFTLEDFASGRLQKIWTRGEGLCQADAKRVALVVQNEPDVKPLLCRGERAGRQGTCAIVRQKDT